MRNFGEIKHDGIAVIQSWTVLMSWDSPDSPDWNPSWKWRMMLYLCKCFHMLVRIMCSITLQRMQMLMKWV